jgi:hypothetical protein
MTAAMFSLLCSECGFITDVNKFVFKVRRKSGTPYACTTCGSDLYKTGSKVKRGKTDNQKRSQKQEKAAAKRLGGRIQPASGAGPAKGDVRADWSARVECKLTRASSFTLKLSQLEKIEREAAPPEKPIFEIEFQGVTPNKRYAVIPGWLLDHFLSLENECDQYEP